MNHNHPVFPQHPNSEIDSGITKREYFALMTLQGLMANCAYDATAESTALVAIRYADALLKELESNDRNG